MHTESLPMVMGGTSLWPIALWRIIIRKYKIKQPNYVIFWDLFIDKKTIFNHFVKAILDICSTHLALYCKLVIYK